MKLNFPTGCKHFLNVRFSITESLSQDFYLFVWQIELLAQLGLVLRAQISVPLEGPLHAADLLCCKGRSGPPPQRRGRWRGGCAALGVGRRWEWVTSFTLVARGLLLCSAAKVSLGGRWKTEIHRTVKFTSPANIPLCDILRNQTKNTCSSIME